MATTKIILSKVDPYILDDTVRSLDALSGNGGGSSTSGSLLPLKANTGNGSGSGSGGGSDGDDDDTDRPYLETSFNQIMGEINKYRSPWMKKQPNNNNNNNEEEILELEQSANEVWDAYRQLYYGHDNSTGSVYFRRKGSGGGDSSSSSGGGGSSPVKSNNNNNKSGAGGGSLEAFFGIQKKCIMTDENENANAGDEFARWDSVHYVTIEEPNYDDKTCEYKIVSTIWCRFKPEDVGDIPPKIKAAQPKKAQPVIIKKPPAAAKPKSPNFKGLDVSRLEIFDKAKDNWNNRHSNSKDEEEKKKTTVTAPRQPNNSSPVPAIVTSSAYHEEETIKVCKLLSGSDSNSKNKNKIPIASHIQNIGTEIEKIESNYRKKLEMVHVPKTCEIIQGMYCGNNNNRGSSNGGKSNATSSSSSQSQRRPAGINQHATGMGVGASLIGEIALKAKSKGLGSGGDDNSGGTGNGSKDINKAMESILAAEKMKLVRDNDAAANADTKTNDWKSNLKKNTTSTALPTGTNTATNATTTNDWKSSLKKTSTTSSTTTTTTTTNENATNTSLNLQAGLKKTSTTKPTFTTATKTATPEFLDFRSKLKSASTATITTTTTTPSSPIK